MWRGLTSWKSEGRDVGEGVARPLSLVLLETSAHLLPDAGGQVGVRLGGKTFAGIGRGWRQQQAQNV